MNRKLKVIVLILSHTALPAWVVTQGWSTAAMHVVLYEGKREVIRLWATCIQRCDAIL